MSLSLVTHTRIISNIVQVLYTNDSFTASSPPSSCCKVLVHFGVAFIRVDFFVSVAWVKYLYFNARPSCFSYCKWGILEDHEEWCHHGAAAVVVAFSMIVSFFVSRGFTDCDSSFLRWINCSSFCRWTYRQAAKDAVRMEILWEESDWSICRYTRMTEFTIEMRSFWQAWLVAVLFLIVLAGSDAQSQFIGSPAPSSTISALNIDTTYLSPPLQFDFYATSCPEAPAIVSTMVMNATSYDFTVAPQLLRMFFHDCIVQGCDASLLLNSTLLYTNSPLYAEKDFQKNDRFDKFSFVDLIKQELESVCPGVVSCADILAMAAVSAIAAVRYSLASLIHEIDLVNMREHSLQHSSSSSTPVFQDW